MSSSVADPPPGGAESAAAGSVKHAEPPTWAARYVRIALLATGVAFFASWTAASYLGLSPSAQISFKVADGWCETGFGGHCFGDFSVVTAWFSGDFDPWNGSGGLPASNYPATGWLPALLFSWLGLLAGSEQFGIALYLTAATACLLVPAVWAARAAVRDRLPASALVIGVASAPVLATIDRGNAVAFAVPCVMLVAVGLVERRWGLVVVGVILAAALKPQLAMLAVVLLAHHRFRAFATAAVGTVAVIVLGFVPFPHFPQNLVGWLNAMVAYGSAQSSLVPFPASLGLPRSVLTLADTSGVTLLLGPATRAAFGTWLDDQGGLVSLAFVAALGILIFAVGRRVNPVWTLGLAMFMTLYTSVTVYVYYLALFLPLAALVLSQPSAAGTSGAWRGMLDPPRGDGRHDVVNWVVITALALSLAPVILPYQVLPKPLSSLWGLDGSAGVYQLLAGALLLLLCLVLAVGLLVRGVGGGRERVMIP